MTRSRIELLQAMPIFGGISGETLQFLIDCASIVEKTAAEHFFREGEKADAMFVLESGKVAVSKQWNGQDHLLKELSQGDCFGEMAVIDLSPRSASVMAIEPCSAIAIDYANMLDLHMHNLEQFTLIQMNIARELSRRLRLSDEQLFQARFNPNQPHGSAD